jgi:hypothetical protein
MVCVSSPTLIRRGSPWTLHPVGGVTVGDRRRYMNFVEGISKVSAVCIKESQKAAVDYLSNRFMPVEVLVDLADQVEEELALIFSFDDVNDNEIAFDDFALDIQEVSEGEGDVDYKVIFSDLSTNIFCPLDKALHLAQALFNGLGDSVLLAAATL